MSGRFTCPDCGCKHDYYDAFWGLCKPCYDKPDWVERARLRNTDPEAWRRLKAEEAARQAEAAQEALRRQQAEEALRRQQQQEAEERLRREAAERQRLAEPIRQAVQEQMREQQAQSQRQLDQLQAELGRSQAARDQERQEAQTEVRRLQRSLDELRPQLQQAQTRSRDLEAQLASCRAAQDELRPQLEQAQKRSSDLEAELASSRAAQDELRPQLEQARARIAELEAASAASSAERRTVKIVEAWAEKTCKFARARPDEVQIDRTDPANFLGRGSFSTVYAATFQGKRVAAKVIELGTAPEQQQLERVKQEAAVLYGLQHEHFLKLLALVEDKTKHEIILVTELCDRGSLYDVLNKLHREQNRGLLEPEALKAAYEVASAMQHLHSKNIVHRDLKSLNILVTATSSMKVGDMGMAEIHQSLRTGTIRPASADAQPKGTVRWMAPELFDAVHAPTGHALKPCDVYSFAIILFEILTGLVPWHRVAAAQENAVIPTTVMRGSRPEEVPGVPRPQGALAEVMRQGWHQEPLQRPPFAEVLHRLALARTNIVERWTFTVRCQESSSPIVGVRAPGQQMGLSQALQRIGFPRWQQVHSICQRQAEVMRHVDKLCRDLDEEGRTVPQDVFLAVTCYTLEEGGQFYSAMNRALQERNPAQMGQYLPFLNCMLRAYDVLPSTPVTVYRGDILANSLREGQVFYWSNFTSTSTSPVVALDVIDWKRSRGDAGDQVLYIIYSQDGRDIKKLSSMPHEYEVLLWPGTKLKVLGLFRDVAEYRRFGIERANLQVVVLQELPVNHSERWTE